MNNLIRDDNNISLKRELPFKYPKVCTYPYFTALIGILGAYNKEDIWILNNYLLIWALKKLYHIEYWIDFKYGNEDRQEEFCPMINKTVITRKFIEDNYESLKNAIKYFIDQKQYIFVSVDVFYINEWWGNKSHKRHFRHQLLIHGYDYENNILTVSDFINGKYRTVKIDFKKFSKGYYNYDKHIPYEDFGKDIWLLSYNENVEETINLERIYYLIKDYLSSSDTHIINYIQLRGSTDNYVYGLNVFSELIKYLEEVVKQNSKFIDVRPFHILLEMHRVMLWRLEYIFSHYKLHNSEIQNDVIESVKQQTQNTKILESLVLKYNLTNQKNLIRSIQFKLTDLVSKEKEMLELCLKVIDLAMSKIHKLQP